MRKIKKVTEQIERNLAKGVKIDVFGLGSESGPRGPPLGDSMGSSSSWLIEDILI